MIDKILDRYAWGARLVPALITCVPVGLPLAAWIPKLEDTLRPVVALVSATGILILLTHIARAAGKYVEPKLIGEWGGLSSVALLRHTDNRHRGVTKHPYHPALGQSLPEVTLPTLDEELANPGKADAIYRACSDFLRNTTRDEKKFPLLLTDDISYGFRRNLYGLRPLGTVVAIASMGACIWKLVRDHNTATSPAVPVACLLLCAALTGVWLIVVN
jgi:hypothetical protein